MLEAYIIYFEGTKDTPPTYYLCEQIVYTQKRFYRVAGTPAVCIRKDEKPEIFSFLYRKFGTLKGTRGILEL